MDTMNGMTSKDIVGFNLRCQCGAVEFIRDTRLPAQTRQAIAFWKRHTGANCTAMPVEHLEHGEQSVEPYPPNLRAEWPRITILQSGNLSITDPQRGIGLVLEPPTVRVMWIVLFSFIRVDYQDPGRLRLAEPVRMEFGLN